MLVPSYNVLNGFVSVKIILAGTRARVNVPLRNAGIARMGKVTSTRLTIRPVDTMLVPLCNQCLCVKRQIPLNPFSKEGMGVWVPPELK